MESLKHAGVMLWRLLCQDLLKLDVSFSERTFPNKNCRFLKANWAWPHKFLGGCAPRPRAPLRLLRSKPVTKIAGSAPACSVDRMFSAPHTQLTANTRSQYQAGCQILACVLSASDGISRYLLASSRDQGVVFSGGSFIVKIFS